MKTVWMELSLSWVLGALLLPVAQADLQGLCAEELEARFRAAPASTAEVWMLDSLNHGSSSYRKWSRALGGDERSAISRRIKKYKESEYLGDFKAVNHSERGLHEALFEMRIHTGVGVRLYFLKRDQRIVIVGFGTKDGGPKAQTQDIERAAWSARQWIEGQVNPSVLDG